MDASYLTSDVDGLLPWIPQNLSDAQTMRWEDGLKWELEYYPTKFQPKDIHPDLRKERKLSLLRLHQVTLGNPEALIQKTMVTFDRLVLTKGISSQIQMSVLACYLKHMLDYVGAEEATEVAEKLAHRLNIVASATDLLARVAWVEEVLGHFSKAEMHTPADWFREMRPAGSYTDSQIDTVFFYLGLQGSLAHLPPSSVAAAVMAKFMGGQAEPFMHGYDLFDIIEAKSEVDLILDNVGDFV